MEMPERQLSPIDSAAWKTPQFVEFTQILLNSFRDRLGRELLPRQSSPATESEALFHAPFVVVAHGTETDPILCYGNRTALLLWEVDLATLTRTPSRLTAEPMHRDERARLLERTTRDGYVDDYRGIRISSTGQRFLIEQAIVWNLHDRDGNRIGQAATFADWKFLEPTETG